MFGAMRTFFLMCYNTVISSAISFGVACSGGNVSKHDQGKVEG